MGAFCYTALRIYGSFFHTAPRSYGSFLLHSSRRLWELSFTQLSEVMAALFYTALRSYGSSVSGIRTKDIRLYLRRRGAIPGVRTNSDAQRHAQGNLLGHNPCSLESAVQAFLRTSLFDYPALRPVSCFSRAHTLHGPSPDAPGYSSARCANTGTRSPGIPPQQHHLLSSGR